uniref:Trafficking protein particle complex subunit 2-like protein n=1 Tax=Tetraselmis sp. GSL018 TaxID=582737 RepID=A0A061QM00_9CHLO|mmetsp:Transcript_28393/g.67573  ORF Transcript_28393/g.67573 Transcript_28393/m.67573 type:complete len:143 (-) Transcript_28393:397-825(-)
MTVVCAAVIGAHNNPLYLQTFPSGTDEEQLKFHYIVHCSLDAIEEKVAMPKRAPNEVNDAYLGLLFPTEDCSVYGYMGSTRVKIVLVLDKSDTKDQELRKAFQQMHVAYANAIANPFHTAGQPIASRSFDNRVRQIVGALPA